MTTFAVTTEDVIHAAACQTPSCSRCRFVHCSSHWLKKLVDVTMTPGTGPTWLQSLEEGGQWGIRCSACDKRIGCRFYDICRHLKLASHIVNVKDSNSAWVPTVQQFNDVMKDIQDRTAPGKKGSPCVGGPKNATVFENAWQKHMPFVR